MIQIPHYCLDELLSARIVSIELGWRYGIAAIAGSGPGCQRRRGPRVPLNQAYFEKQAIILLAIEFPRVINGVGAYPHYILGFVAHRTASHNDLIKRRFNFLRRRPL